jgi:uncharacterized protein with FMN-binding domain
MRRITIAIASTITALVLLFSYHTSTDQNSVSASGSVPLGRRTTTTGAAPTTATSAPPSTSSTSGSSSAGASGTFAGGAADTRYGPVQVQITMSGGRITAAQALQVPQESGRDVRINSEAVPILVDETLQAQSAQIDTVSGATYTSEGYTQSLQSAIDAANR